MLDGHDMELYEMNPETFRSFINIRIKKYNDDEELERDFGKIRKLLINDMVDKNTIKQIEILMHKNKDWFGDNELYAEDLREIYVLIGDIYADVGNHSDACGYYEAALKNLEKVKRKAKKSYKDGDDSEEMLKEIKTNCDEESEKIREKMKRLWGGNEKIQKRYFKGI